MFDNFTAVKLVVAVIILLSIFGNITITFYVIFSQRIKTDVYKIIIFISIS